MKLIRSQGGWIRSSSGPLLTEQAVEGVREDALHPLKAKFLIKKNCGINQDPKTWGKNQRILNTQILEVPVQKYCKRIQNWYWIRKIFEL